MNGARQTAETPYIWKICDVPNKKAAQCPRGRKRKSQAERGQTGYVQAKVKSTHSKLIILRLSVAGSGSLASTLTRLHFFKILTHSGSEIPFPFAIVNDDIMPKDSSLLKACIHYKYLQ